MIALILTMILAQAQTPAPTTVAQGASSAMEDAHEVVARSPAEWAALWKSHAGLQPAPTVDFSTQVVAAVFLGTRPTAGFRVTITGARREGESLVIEWVESAPGAGGMVAQVLTSPVHIVSLPRHEGPIRFVKAAGTVPGINGGIPGK